MKKTSKTEKPSNKMNSKRLAALIGVALLAALYVVTLIVAIMDTSSSGKWFRICLLATFTIPLLIWIYTWMYGKLTGRHTIADLNANTAPDREADAAPDKESGTAPDDEITL